MGEAAEEQAEEVPKYLCMGPHVWAVGPTLKEAVKNLKKMGSVRKAEIRFTPIPMNVDPKSVYVNEIGSICWQYIWKYTVEEVRERWNINLEPLP